jgi:hypothetical protein
VVLEQNPNGQLTNLDLKMAGVLLQYLVMEELVLDLSQEQAVIGHLKPFLHACASYSIA